MFFAYRTKQRLRIVLVICLSYALLVAALAALFPTEGKTFASSFWRWFAVIPVGFCIYAVIELFGTWSLNRPFWQRMPSWSRILLLVLLIALGVAGFVFARHYF